MGLFDIFNAGKIRKENENLKELMETDMGDAVAIAEKIAELETRKEKLEKQNEKLSDSINTLKEKIIEFEETISVQDFGLYTPRYNFVTAEEYKIALDNLRLQYPF